MTEDTPRERLVRQGIPEDFKRPLRARIREYALHAAVVPADERGSVEWVEKIGKFWWEAREQEGLTRDDVASRMGEDVNGVRFLEYGVGYEELHLSYNGSTLTALDLEFAQRYANALGKPELFEAFKERFQIS